MISHKHNCIFIHIPKTAGTSVEKKLGLFDKVYWGAQDHSTIKEIQPLSLLTRFGLLIKQDYGFSRRTLLMEMIRNSRRVSKKTFHTYFKFTIVRNPWDRVYSWYRNTMNDPNQGIAAGIQECDFKTFIKEYLDAWALRPQLYWITDFNDEIQLDYIVKFENLIPEISYVLDRLGFLDLTLPHLLDSSENNTLNQDYRSVYDSQSIEIIANRYKEEIELFDYKFN